MVLKCPAERMVNMKKLLAIITVFCFVLTLCTPGIAATTDEEHARVLQLIKSRIPDTQEFGEFDSSSYKNNGKTVYNFSWQQISEDDDALKTMHISASESGIITSYNYNDFSKETHSSKPSLKKIGTQQAMKSCEELFAKINPIMEGKFELSVSGRESLNSRTHNFSIQRTENGIPVYGDSGYVTLNEDADAIISFNINYTENVVFPDAGKSISKEEAQNKFAEKIGMTLLYEMSYASDEPSPFVAYKLDTYNTYIDALSGEAIKPISPKYDRYLSKNEAAMDSAAPIVSGGGFSKAELSELEKIAGLLTEEEAVGLIKNNPILSIEKDASLAYTSLYGADDDKFIYSMRFETPDGDRMNVTFDAKTGEISSFNRSYAEYKDYKDKTADEAKAKQYVASLASEYYSEDDSGEYRLEENNNPEFTFVRYINNIPFYNDSISIRISPEDNALLSYYFSRTDVEFPYPDSILSEKEGCDRLFEQVDYDLFYYPACSGEKMDYCDIVHLVYILDESKNHTIYADSGNLVNGSSESEITGEYTDISGHWAEKIITELARYSIGFADDEFRPDDVIVQKDYIELLTSVVARNYPVVIAKNHNYENTYSYASRRNIIKPGEEAPEDAVTREKAAVYMIRAIDLEPVAQLEDIYRPMYSDVTENTGYISLLTGMKIVNGFDGYFNPQKQITRAEAMAMIYNYLAN